MRPAVLCSLLLIFLNFCHAQQHQNRGYYRFPAIYRDSIVFTAEGDLWQVSAAGGLATRLTSSPGQEESGAFSPDGQTLAFTANYEGPSEVYTMPVSGGVPRRRTFDGQAIVEGWTPDGKFSSRAIATRHCRMPSFSP